MQDPLDDNDRAYIHNKLLETERKHRCEWCGALIDLEPHNCPSCGNDRRYPVISGPDDFDAIEDDILRPKGKNKFARPIPEILIPVTEYTVEGETWLHLSMDEGTYEEFQNAPVKLQLDGKIYLKSAWDSNKRIIGYGPPHLVPRKYARVVDHSVEEIEEADANNAAWLKGELK